MTISEVECGGTLLMIQRNFMLRRCLKGRILRLYFEREKFLQQPNNESDLRQNGEVEIDFKGKKGDKVLLH